LIRYLETQPFWGNVRELENAVQRMLFSKSGGRSLSIADWMAQAPDKAEPHAEAETDPGLLDQAAGMLWTVISNGMSYKAALREVERRVLENAASAGGTRRELANLMRTSERTLYYKMRAQRR
jgi:DNA-binding NtrC family response regulator